MSDYVFTLYYDNAATVGYRDDGDGYGGFKLANKTDQVLVYKGNVSSLIGETVSEWNLTLDASFAKGAQTVTGATLGEYGDKSPLTCVKQK